MFSTESFHGDGEVCGRKRLGRGRHPSFSDGNLPSSFNPFTPGILRKVRFLNILVIIRLDLGQITFNPVENVFATQQLAFLATSIAQKRKKGQGSSRAVTGGTGVNGSIKAYTSQTKGVFLWGDLDQDQ